MSIADGGGQGVAAAAAAQQQQPPAAAAPAPSYNLVDYVFKRVKENTAAKLEKSIEGFADTMCRDLAVDYLETGRYPEDSYSKRVKVNLVRKLFEYESEAALTDAAKKLKEAAADGEFDESDCCFMEVATVQRLSCAAAGLHAAELHGS